MAAFKIPDFRENSLIPLLLEKVATSKIVPNSQLQNEVISLEWQVLEAKKAAL